MGRFNRFGFFLFIQHKLRDSMTCIIKNSLLFIQRWIINRYIYSIHWKWPQQYLGYPGFHFFSLLLRILNITQLFLFEIITHPSHDFLYISISLFIYLFFFSMNRFLFAMHDFFITPRRDLLPYLGGCFIFRPRFFEACRFF